MADPVLTAIVERLDDFTAQGLAVAVSRAVGDGAVPAGALLPPIRTVAAELALSPTTVSSAWRTLTAAGVLRTEGRRGTRVVARTAPRPERYGRVLDQAGTTTGSALDLSSGVPDPALLPDLGPALARLPSTSVPQSYLDDPVLPALRAHLLADWPAPAEDLLVTDGAMDAIALVAGAVLRFGDRVGVEHPTFPPLLDLLESSGVEVVGLAMDHEGVTEEAFATAARMGLAAVLLQPRGHNPTGLCLSPRRARRLAALAREHDVLVVEDDSVGAVSTSEPVSVARWAPGHVVHVRSFSKSHGPDLRLAAMSAPAPLLGRVAVRRQLGQGWTSRLLQALLLDLLTDEDAVSAVLRARDEYAARRAGLIDGLAAHGVTCGGADGLNVWVPVADEAAALVHLAGHGVAAAPGAPFAAGLPLSPHVRITSAVLADAATYTGLVAEAARARSWSPRSR